MIYSLKFLLTHLCPYMPNRVEGTERNISLACAFLAVQIINVTVNQVIYVLVRCLNSIVPQFSNSLPAKDLDSKKKEGGLAKQIRSANKREECF